jgi:predicted N-acyltransferase
LIPLTVDVFDAISSVDEQTWDSLVGDAGYFCSHHWVRSHEMMPAKHRAYVGVRSAGVLVGVAPIWFAPYELSEEYSQAGVGDVLGAAGPVAMAGPRRGYTNGWIIAPWLSGSDRDMVLDRLVTTCIEVARAWQLAAVAVPFITSAGLSWLASLRSVRSRAVESEAVLDVPDSPAGTFDDYLAGLPSKRGREVARERRLLERQGLRIEVEAAAPGCAAILAALVLQVEAKHGRAPTLNGMRRYLRSTFEADLEHGRVFACRDADGRLVAAALAYEWRSILYVKAYGADYGSIPAGARAYFNTVFYEPIEYSLGRRLKQIRYGIGAMPAKQARGCRAEVLHHVLLG